MPGFPESVSQRGRILESSRVTFSSRVARLSPCKDGGLKFRLVRLFQPLSAPVSPSPGARARAVEQGRRAWVQSWPDATGRRKGRQSGLPQAELPHRLLILRAAGLGAPAPLSPAAGAPAALGAGFSSLVISWHTQKFYVISLWHSGVNWRVFGESKCGLLGGKVYFVLCIM